MTLIACSLSGCSKEEATDKNELLSVVFSKTGNISEYKTTGFSGPEKDATWTDGKNASIEIPLPQVAEGEFISVSLDACPFAIQRLKKQIVSVFVNDQYIKDFNMLGCSDKYVFDLPHDLQKLGQVANIKFSMSNAKSPKQLGMSNDTRKLGMSVKKIVLLRGDKDNPESFSLYKMGNKIDFSSKGDSSLYVKSGWSGAESTHTWTDGQDAYIDLFVKDTKGKPLQLEIEGRGISAPADKSQKVTVFVNDRELTTWDVVNEFATYTVKIPEEVVGTGALKVRFNIAKPFVGKTDSRRLGLLVKQVTISNRSGSKTKNRVALWLKDKMSKLFGTTKD